MSDDTASDPLQSDTGVPIATAAMRLQILSTEHWSLLASRALAWNEVFSRSTMFLATLSGAVVTLALVWQLSGFGEGFLSFGLVILPIVLFVGLATMLRLSASNHHDALCVLGMNRIRHAYLEMAPDLQPYFVMSPNDDVRGIMTTMGIPPNTPSISHFLAATPTLISVLNAIVAGAIAVMAAARLGAPAWAAAVAAAAAFLTAGALQQQWGLRAIARARDAYQPLFPSSDA